MYILLNNTNLNNIQLQNNFTYEFVKETDLAVERLDFDVVAVEDFKITSNNFLLNSNNKIIANVYNENDFLIFKGFLIINNYNLETDLTNISIIPEILTNLEKFPKLSYPIGIQNPCDILENIFYMHGLEHALDLPSFNKIKAKMDAYDVKCGLETNLEQDETTIYDILNDFRSAFILDIFIKNNKICFDYSLYKDVLGLELNQNHIITYQENYTEDDIINDWSVNQDNFSLSLSDIDETTGADSRKIYGSKKQEISPSYWQCVDSSSNPDSGWFTYVIDTMQSKIEKYKTPKKVIDLTIKKDLIDELELNQSVVFNSQAGYITRIAREEEISQIKIDI